jgi:large subunit ribosomal protein L18
MSGNSVAIKRSKQRLIRRRKHIKKIVFGTPARPRVVVFRSNRHIYAQIVDDSNSKTICGCSSLTPSLKEKVASSKGKLDTAKIVGGQLAVLAKEHEIDSVCFDRNGNRYHGRVKALADAIRAGGIKF